MKTSILDISMGTLRFAKDSLSSLYNMVSSTEGMEEMLDMGPL